MLIQARKPGHLDGHKGFGSLSLHLQDKRVNNAEGPLGQLQKWTMNTNDQFQNMLCQKEEMFYKIKKQLSIKIEISMKKIR
jgi:hypothetical protein